MAQTHRLDIDGETVRKRFVTWDDGEADREWAGLTRLAAAAPDLAPLPIAFEHEDSAPVVVMSRVPGTALGTAPVTQAQVRAFAGALRRLFAVPAEPDLAERPFGPSTMRGAIREWAVGPYDLARCQDPALVDLALQQARALTSTLEPDDRIVDRVTARGDGNLANVIWDGQVCRLVDFEEYGASDLTFELADIVEHAASRLPPRLDAGSFVEEFALDDRQRARLGAHRRLFAAFWLVMLLPGNRGFDRNPPGSVELQAQHLVTLVRAQGVQVLRCNGT